jgi:N-acetylneuraminic acid mutarotase
MFHSAKTFLFKILALVCLGLTFAACSPGGGDDDISLGNWRQIRSGFPGVSRNAASSFQIGSTVYVGLGFDSNGDRLRDFWAYNAEGGFWEELGRTTADAAARFPGSARNGGVAFALNGRGYVGLGYDNNYRDDFYEYNPTTRRWRRLADFPGGGRRNAVAFVIGNRAYVGTGFNGNTLSDFWAYDATTDAWTLIRDFGGGKREGACAFVLNNRGYVAFGTSNSVNQRSIYEYDPASNNWTEKPAIDDEDDLESRSSPVAFVVNNRAFIGLGANGGLYLSDIWEYDPGLDDWVELAPITENCGAGRSQGIGFAHAGQGYITTGFGTGGRLDDFWSFSPLQENDGCD